MLKIHFRIPNCFKVKTLAIYMARSIPFATPDCNECYDIRKLPNKGCSIIFTILMGQPIWVQNITGHSNIFCRVYLHKFLTWDIPKESIHNLKKKLINNPMLHFFLSLPFCFINHIMKTVIEKDKNFSHVRLITC